MKAASKRRSFWQAVGLLGLDALLFGTTDVSKVPSFMLMVGFLLLTATLYLAIHNLLKLSRLYGVTIRRQRHLCLYLTGILSGLLALQSVGQLSSRDILVLLPLTIVGYSYGTYLKSAGRNFGS